MTIVAALLVLPVVSAAGQRKTSFVSVALNPDNPTSATYDGVPAAEPEPKLAVR